MVNSIQKKVVRPIILGFLLLLMAAIGIRAQSSIKFNQQKTNFYYFQVNTNYGKFMVNDETRLGLGSYGSTNQLAFQWFSKKQKRLQRGYTPSWETGDFFIRMNVEAKPSYISGQEHIRLRVNLLAWMSILTKYDRTKVHIGIRNLPYGHNPRIDADFAFISPQVKSDLGFVNDFGFFTKTALTGYLDLESALTLGGYLSRPVGETRVINQVNPTADLFSLNDFKYQGSWLLTNRIGIPTYERMEYGLFLALGHIYSSERPGELEADVHIGGDFIFKHKDMLKFASQISYGFTNPDQTIYEPYRSLSIQSTLDLTYMGMVNFSISHNWRKLHYDSGMGSQSRTIMASATLVVTSDLKLRLNGYKELQTSEVKDPYGIFWQMILGVGDRK